jgi:hypothetical protein
VSSFTKSMRPSFKGIPSRLVASSSVWDCNDYSGPARSTRTRTLSMQPRTACAWQSIDREVVAWAEPAIADEEPGFRGRGPPGKLKALTIQPKNCRNDRLLQES